MGYQDYINRAVGGSRRGGAEMANYLNELALAHGERWQQDPTMTTFGGPTPANPYIDKLMQAKLAASDREAQLGAQGAGIAGQLEGLRERTAAQKALQEAMLTHQTSERTGAQQWKSDESVEDRIFRGSQQSNLLGHQAEQGKLGRESQMALAQLSAGTTHRGQDIGLQQAQMNLAAQQARDQANRKHSLSMWGLANPNQTGAGSQWASLQYGTPIMRGPGGYGAGYGGQRGPGTIRA
jgi:hypothetical protein